MAEEISDFEFYDSSDNEKETRVIKSQKEKQFNLLDEALEKLVESINSKNFLLFFSCYENVKSIASNKKTAKVIAKEGIPEKYIVTMIKYKNFVETTFQNKQQFKKLKQNDAKLIAKLHQKIKIIPFFDQIVNFENQQISKTSKISSKDGVEIVENEKNEIKGQKIKKDNVEKDEKSEENSDFEKASGGKNEHLVLEDESEFSEASSASSFEELSDSLSGFSSDEQESKSTSKITREFWVKKSQISGEKTEKSKIDEKVEKTKKIDEKSDKIGEKGEKIDKIDDKDEKTLNLEEMFSELARLGSVRFRPVSEQADLAKKLLSLGNRCENDVCRIVVLLYRFDVLSDIFDAIGGSNFEQAKFCDIWNESVKAIENLINIFNENDDVLSKYSNLLSDVTDNIDVVNKTDFNLKKFNFLKEKLNQKAVEFSAIGFTLKLTEALNKFYSNSNSKFRLQNRERLLGELYHSIGLILGFFERKCLSKQIANAASLLLKATYGHSDVLSVAEAERLTCVVLRNSESDIDKIKTTIRLSIHYSTTGKDFKKAKTLVESVLSKIALFVSKSMNQNGISIMESLAVILNKAVFHLALNAFCEGQFDFCSSLLEGIFNSDLVKIVIKCDNFHYKLTHLTKNDIKSAYMLSSIFSSAQNLAKTHSLSNSKTSLSSDSVSDSFNTASHFYKIYTIFRNCTSFGLCDSILNAAPLNHFDSTNSALISELIFEPSDSHLAAFCFAERLFCGRDFENFLPFKNFVDSPQFLIGLRKRMKLMAIKNLVKKSKEIALVCYLTRFGKNCRLMPVKILCDRFGLDFDQVQNLVKEAFENGVLNCFLVFKNGENGENLNENNENLDKNNDKNDENDENRDKNEIKTVENAYIETIGKKVTNYEKKLNMLLNKIQSQINTKKQIVS